MLVVAEVATAVTVETEEATPRLIHTLAAVVAVATAATVDMVVTELAVAEVATEKMDMAGMVLAHPSTMEAVVDMAAWAVPVDLRLVVAAVMIPAVLVVRDYAS